MTDVLDRNVETLLETGGAPPRMDDAARVRIRGALIAAHAAPAAAIVGARSPMRAVVFGLVAVAAGALIVTRFVGDGSGSGDGDGNGSGSGAAGSEIALADGTTVLLGPAGHVDVLGARHVRITGAALLDVVPGKGAFTVDTAAAEVRVLGTRFVVDAGADRTIAAVVRGEVELRTAAGEVALHAGEQGTAQSGRAPTRSPAPRLTQLVSWAREARHHDAPSAAGRHGTLYARDPNRPFVPEIALPLSALTVDVVVEDQVARVALDQTFHNPSDIAMEGMYRFAIPPDAALQRLAMYNAGKLTEAAVVARMDARRIYEDAVYRRVDPALLEWAGTGRLALRVYPLAPRDDKRLILAYTQSLPKLYDDWTLTVPLPELPLPVDDTAPPFGGADGRRQAPTVGDTAPPFGGADGRRQAPTVGDTAPPFGGADGRRQAPTVGDTAPPFGGADGRRQAPTVGDTAPPFGGADGGRQAPTVGDLAFDVRVRDCAACELSSPDYQLSVTRDGGDAIVHYRAYHAKLGDSLVIHVRDPRRAATVAQVTAPGTGEAFVLVRAPADLHAAPRVYQPRSWVILDDVSASRDALARHAQADLVDAFLAELDEQDRVSVVAFDVTQRTILPPTRVLDVDRAAVRAALRGEPGGVGATDLGGALTAALAQLPPGATGADASIVYLGDGVITAGPRTLDTLRAQLVGKAQFIGVGVGDGPDTQTLDALAAATAGYATTIDLGDDLTWRAFDLVAALHTPRVTGMTARLVDVAGALVPATAYLRSAQLADGEQLELVARLAPGLGAGVPVAAEINGTLDGAPWQRRIAFADAAPAHGDAGFLPRLWAERHIAARMLAKHEPVTAPDCQAAAAGCATLADVREQRDEAIRKEVVALGTRYFLLTRHTSLLVLEDDAMYARYGVTKGAGQTWAPYALPATIPVASTSALAAGADDAPLPPRVPMPVLAVPELELRPRRGVTIDEHTIVTARTGADDGVADRAPADSAPADSMDLSGGEQPRDRAYAATLGWKSGLREKSEAFDDRPSVRRISVAPTDNLEGTFGKHSVASSGAFATASLIPYDNPFVPGSLRNGNDQAFDDLSERVPALFDDASDDWRTALAAASDGATAHPIDDAARAILSAARTRLPTGVYHWDGVELAVDDARALGWRRTTGSDLVEAAAVDPTAPPSGGADGRGQAAAVEAATWTRRYPELDLAVTRPVAVGELGLGLAYLPILIADPAAWTRWFEVRARGAREVALTSTADGKARTVLVLAFDDRYRLVAVHDGGGRALLTVTWNASGPVAATVNGQPIAVGFTAQPVASAAAWAWGDAAAPGAVVELPARGGAYWARELAAAPVGSASWRHAQRQLLVTTAATHDGAAAWHAYRALLDHGGVALGDLVLASGGVARATTDAELARALAPWSGADRPAVVRYLAASRAFERSSGSPPPAHAIEPGMIGALWALRTIDALIDAKRGAQATDQLIALGDRAIDLRLAAASALQSSPDAPVAAIDRAWDTFLVGRYHNLARVQQVLIHYDRGQVDAAADRLAALLADVDLAALPALVSSAPSIFAQSRRGSAGWQLAWTGWRDRVLAAGDLGHVLALLTHARATDDAPRVLARAAALAGEDRALRTDLVRWAAGNGERAWAQAQLDDLLARDPTPELDRLHGELLRAEDRAAAALAAYEAAESLPAADHDPLALRRDDFQTIVALGKQIALGTTGAARDALVIQLRGWGTRWRAIDPDNAAIDAVLGGFELALGDRAEAWRQLSTAVERDPMAGDGYMQVAEAFEHEGRIADALDYWQQAIALDQTNPTPRLAKAKALFALGRVADGDALLAELARRRWHVRYDNVVEQVRELRASKH